MARFYSNEPVYHRKNRVSKPKLKKAPREAYYYPRQSDEEYVSSDEEPVFVEAPESESESESEIDSDVEVYEESETDGEQQVIVRDAETPEEESQFEQFDLHNKPTHYKLVYRLVNPTAISRIIPSSLEVKFDPAADNLVISGELIQPLTDSESDEEESETESLDSESESESDSESDSDSDSDSSDYSSDSLSESEVQAALFPEEEEEFDNEISLEKVYFETFFQFARNEIEVDLIHSELKGKNRDKLVVVLPKVNLYDEDAEMVDVPIKGVAFESDDESEEECVDCEDCVCDEESACEAGCECEEEAACGCESDDCECAECECADCGCDSDDELNVPVALESYDEEEEIESADSESETSESESDSDSESESDSDDIAEYPL